jgi:hypothetical protein
MRILRGISWYQHGGALLFTVENISIDLDIKYPIQYARLGEAILAKTMYEVLYYCCRDYIIENYIHQGADSLPIDLLRWYHTCRERYLEAATQLKGCIRFVASLSRVDGLILIDDSLTINGFGTIITAEQSVGKLYAALDEHATSRLTQRISPTCFGTRHRSMMRYCDKHPGSIGFVVSEDGHTRAITKIRRRLVLWDRIQTSMSVQRSHETDNPLENPDPDSNS